MKKIPFFLALLSTTITLAQTYPAEIRDRFILSKARLDNKEITVLLDTGAPGIVLNNRHYKSNQFRSTNCIGINGTFDCAQVTIDQWNWLGHELHNPEAILSDLSFLEKGLQCRIDALVGLSALDNRSLRIDFDQQTLTVSDQLPSGKEIPFVRFAYADHLPVILCEVNGEQKYLGIDTGSESNYLFGQTEFPPADQWADIKKVFVVGTDSRENLKHILPMEVEIDDQLGMMTSEFIVNLEGAGFFHPAGFDGLLGQRFLGQYNLIIHPGKQRIYFLPRKQWRDVATSAMP